MPAVFSMQNWQHSCTAERLELKRGHLYRKTQPNDPLKGVILYADLERKDIEQQNLLHVLNAGIPCWPNPGTMLRMIERHTVFAECVAAGFVQHPTLQLLGGVANPDQIDEMIVYSDIRYPAVFKTGNVHRGEGKHLVNCKEEIPSWEGIATIEPFFKGRSVRVLIIGDSTFGIEVTNEETWIKNAAGAEINEFEIPLGLRTHADAVAKHFSLAVAGIDYIVTDQGFYFLEVNQYPGFAGFDHVMDCAKDFLKQKMREIEKKTST